MPTSPLVKCRNCFFLGTAHDPDGLMIRCVLGYYDGPDHPSPSRTVPIYYSVLSLKSGNVGIWQAIKKCGDNYKVVERRSR